MAEEVEKYDVRDMFSIKEEYGNGYKVFISETAIGASDSQSKDYRNSELSTPAIKTETPAVYCHTINESIKTEEDVNITPVKIENDMENKLLFCDDCHAYYQDYCSTCGMLVHILNRNVLRNTDNEGYEEMPQDVLEIRGSFGQRGMFALKAIPAGVKFGPFTGLNRTELPRKIRDGTLVLSDDELKYLNWMQYVNPARNISEQNLLVLQHEDDLYYQSTRKIQKGDELLVYFGEEYEDSFNKNVEVAFIPNTKHIFKDAFACTFCCLGFNSKSCLVKHKAICPGNVDGAFSIEELIQCPTCKIHLDQKEYFTHHMTYCSEKTDRKCILPTPGNRMTQANGRKTGQCQLYKCEQCKYRTKYKGDLKNHNNLHYGVKTYKCEVCGRRFKTKEVLMLHVENAHILADGKDDLEHSSGIYIKSERSCSQNETKQFKCSFCEFQTQYKITLKAHVKVKHSKQFKCDTCVYKTNRKQLLEAHIQTEHLKEFKYKCDACDYKTNHKSNLNTHKETRHLKEYKYKCDTCDFKANLKSWLARHIEAKHLNVLKYKCDACDYKTIHKNQLQTHIEVRHLKAFKYKCDRCDYKANVKSYLKRHIETKHLKNFKYKCGACNYKTYLKPNLRTHLQTRHLKEFKYKCDTCDYKANVESYLKRHIETKHLKNLKYKCDACDYKTNLKSSLKTHLDTIHLKEFKHKCDMCDYKANQKSQLKTHIQTRHLKEFRYNCATCDYKTNWKSNLKTHVATKHLKEFKYKCDTCNYKANQECQLKTHIVTRHMKEFNYKCESCDYKASWKFQLKTHVDTKHLNVFKHVCERCGYKTNNLSNIKNHMKRKHF